MSPNNQMTPSQASQSGISRRDFLGQAASLAVVAGVASGPSRASGSAGAATHNIGVRRGVATYSYQEEVMARAMSCEDVIREVADVDAYGFELLAEMLVPNFPNPPAHWVDQWHSWIDKYGVKPMAYTQFIDTMRTMSHNLTLEEGVQTMLRDIKLAKLLGIPHIRALVGTPIEILEATIPHLEKHDIWLGVEIHAPLRMDMPLVERITRMAEKTTRFGFVPDFGIFQNKPNTFARDQMVRQGAMTREAALYIEDAWERKVGQQDVLSQLDKMTPGPGAAGYATTVYRINPVNPKDLLPVMAYCRHIHGKTWGLDDNCNDPAIDLSQVIPTLVKGGYNGIIATEYEGQRIMGDIMPMSAVEMVRRHQVLMRRLLEA